MKQLLVIITTVVLAACGNKIPDIYRESGDLPTIYPDYTNVTVPVGVEEISSNAFAGCNKMTALTLPNGLKSIGNFAFSQCSALTSLTIKNGIRPSAARPLPTAQA